MRGSHDEAEAQGSALLCSALLPCKLPININQSHNCGIYTLSRFNLKTRTTLFLIVFLSCRRWLCAPPETISLNWPREIDSDRRITEITT